MFTGFAPRARRPDAATRRPAKNRGTRPGMPDGFPDRARRLNAIPALPGSPASSGGPRQFTAKLPSLLNACAPVPGAV